MSRIDFKLLQQESGHKLSSFFARFWGYAKEQDRQGPCPQEAYISVRMQISKQMNKRKMGASRSTANHLPCQNSRFSVENWSFLLHSVELCPLEVSKRNTPISPNQRALGSLWNPERDKLWDLVPQVRAVKEGFRWGSIVWQELPFKCSFLVLSLHSICTLACTFLIVSWMHRSLAWSFFYFITKKMLRNAYSATQIFLYIYTSSPTFLW